MLRDLINVVSNGYQGCNAGKFVPLRIIEDIWLSFAINVANHRSCCAYSPKKAREELVEQGLVIGLTGFSWLGQFVVMRRRH